MLVVLYQAEIRLHVRLCQSYAWLQNIPHTEVTVFEYRPFGSTQ